MEYDRQIGTSLLMHVMSGDEIQMEVENYYEDYEPFFDFPVDPEDMFDNLVTTLVNGEGGWIGSESSNNYSMYEVFLGNNIPIFEGLKSMITDPDRPKAYLNYMLVGYNLQIVPEFSGSIQADGNGSWSTIGTELRTIPQEGYLVIFLSNESASIYGNSDVYFDQLKIKFRAGNLKEETHYYPFGLPLGGIGSSAPGMEPNRHRYQSNEFLKESGLRWMDFHNRQLGLP
jgi:hypothetical protein